MIITGDIEYGNYNRGGVIKMTEKYIPRFDPAADAAGEGFGVAGEAFTFVGQENSKSQLIEPVSFTETENSNKGRNSDVPRHDFYDAVDLKTIAQMDGRE